MSEPLSPEGYAAAGGSVCPACGGDPAAWAYGSVNMEGGSVSQRIICRDCNAQWWDVYELTGYTDLSIELPKKETT